MIPIYLWELRRRKMFTVWWSIGISALIGMTVASFLAIKDQVDEFNKAFNGLSESAGSFFGGSDFFSPIGYLSSQIYYIILPLLVIILAVTLASSLMSKDETDETIELTLARPVSRSQILFGKALAGVTIVLIVCVTSYIVTAVGAQLVGLQIDQKNLLITHLLSFAFSASFGAISFALIAASRSLRPIAGVIAIVFSFGGYIVSSLGGFVDGLKPIANAVPYHYYNTSDLLSGKVSSELLIYIGVTYVLVVVVMWLGYNRRDIG